MAAVPDTPRAGAESTPSETLGGRAIPEGMPSPKDAWRAGWLRKKPTSETGKPWKSSKIDKRFYVTKGYRVDYYDKALTPGKEVEAAGWRSRPRTAIRQPPASAEAAPAHPV